VDEHAEAGFTPPLHAGVALLPGFGILNGGNRMIGRCPARMGRKEKSGDEEKKEGLAHREGVLNFKIKLGKTAKVAMILNSQSSHRTAQDFAQRTEEGRRGKTGV
jgi:hypothetical protein